MEPYRRQDGSRHLEPLNYQKSEIRLLYLRDGGFEDQIACSIERHYLPFAPPFRAISYTWGTSHDERAIKLNGEQWSVRGNAYYALQQARHFRPKSWVWIDSVCVDQKNTTEKSAQVAIMGEIFARANGVLACIGPADESSEYIRQMLALADQTAQHLQGDRKKSKDYWTAFRQLVNKEDEFTGLVDQWNAFCGRAYFHRLWVVQELFEGKKKCLSILCGLSLLSWNRLVNLGRAIDSRSWNMSANGGRWIQSSSAVRYLDYLLKMRTTSAEFDLAHFVSFVDRLECEDPRDRIYGTLRLIDWDRVGIPRPSPDYTISKFDLGLQIMAHYRNRDFMHISRLASALRLQNDCLGAELKKREDYDDLDQTKLVERSVLYSITIYGAARIGQDANGRLTASLVINRSGSGESGEIDQLVKMIPRRNGVEPLQIFANGQLAALAGPDVQIGDIILITPYFDLILRQQADLTFCVTGKAVLRKGYQTRHYVGWSCDCWAVQEGQSRQRDTFKRIEVSFEASARDALICASYCVQPHDLQNRCRRVATDFPPVGSFVRDVTASKWEPHQYIRPVKDTCPEHDAAACSESSRNGLLFCVASGCGLEVQTEQSEVAERGMAPHETERAQG